MDAKHLCNFFLAVPTMLAATGYKLLKYYTETGGFSSSEIQQLAFGNIVAIAIERKSNTEIESGTFCRLFLRLIIWKQKRDFIQLGDRRSVCVCACVFV